MSIRLPSGSSTFIVPHCLNQSFDDYSCVEQLLEALEETNNNNNSSSGNRWLTDQLSKEIVEDNGKMITHVSSEIHHDHDQYLLASVESFDAAAGAASFSLAPATSYNLVSQSSEYTCNNLMPVSAHQSQFPAPGGTCSSELQDSCTISSVKQMFYTANALQQLEPMEELRRPKRKNMKISKDPQSVAARHRRERISHKIKTLQRLVPGGTKMDTASMLEEAIQYVKFLKMQVQSLEMLGFSTNPGYNIISGSSSLSTTSIV